MKVLAQSSLAMATMKLKRVATIFRHYLMWKFHYLAGQILRLNFELVAIKLLHRFFCGILCIRTFSMLEISVEPC
jgi:hypothetical protein